MRLTVSRQPVWSAEIDDRAGALASKLTTLAEAGADLSFVTARRRSGEPSRAKIYIASLRGARQQRAAEQAGLARTNDLHMLRVEGTDRPGLGATLTQALAMAGISLRGLSAVAIGKRMVVMLAFDTSADAARATHAIKNL